MPLTLTDEIVDKWLDTFERIGHKVSQDILVQEMKLHGLTERERSYIIGRWIG